MLIIRQKPKSKLKIELSVSDRCATNADYRLADLQTRAWVSQTKTSVSQTSALHRYRYRYRYRYIGIGIGIYSIY